MLPGQPVTMEDVLSETAITYPETYVQSLTGSQIKGILEDVCDNLFNADPYYQQGGDMVRVGGMAYTCTPAESVGRRISELKLDNGRALSAGKSYRVAGWASVNAQQGMPVWDILERSTVDRSRDVQRRDRSGDGGNGRFCRPRRADPAARKAVCRAPHCVAALGQRPEKAKSRDQRRLQSSEILRSRQGRDRGGGVRPGDRSAAPRKYQPQAGRKSGRAGRAV